MVGLRRQLERDGCRNGQQAVTPPHRGDAHGRSRPAVVLDNARRARPARRGCRAAAACRTARSLITTAGGAPVLPASTSCRSSRQLGLPRSRRAAAALELEPRPRCADSLPGFCMSALPVRRATSTSQDVILLVGQAPTTSRSTEDVLRAGGPARLDGTGSSSRPTQLPGYGDDASARRPRLLPGMLARPAPSSHGVEQRARLALRQLANTYEELSLIYQITSGMKVNRRAADFFRQACLDVLEVMSVRGMGVGSAATLLPRSRARRSAAELGLPPATGRTGSRPS